MAGIEDTRMSAKFTWIAVLSLLLLAKAEDNAYRYPIHGYVFVDANGNGQRDGGESGAAGIGVSDGRAVALTGADGYYYLPNAEKDANHVFVSRPAHFAKDVHFYHILTRSDRERDYNFPLRRARGEEGSRFSFIQVSDVHIWNADTLSDFALRVKDLDEMDRDAAFVVATGDLGHDDRIETLAMYRDTAGNSSFHWHHAFGNHDVSRGEDCAAGYRRILGPDYYSFDYGDWHFTVLNDSLPGTHKMYDWWAADLNLLSRGKSTAVFMHHPPSIYFFELCKSYPQIRAIFSGHRHGIQNLDRGGVLSFNTGTFRFGGCDFTPPGYRLVHVAGDEIRTTYRFFRKKQPVIAEPLLPREGKLDAGEVAALPPWPEYKNGPGRTGTVAGKVKLPLRQVWKVTLEGSPSSPVTAGGKLFIATRNFDGARGNRVHCLGIEDGSSLWTQELDSPVLVSPTLAGGRLYCQTQLGVVYCFSPDGELLWKRETGDGVNDWIFGAPIVDETRVYAGNLDNLCALDSRTGTPIWKRCHGRSWEFSNAILATSDYWLATGAIWAERNIIVADKSSGEILEEFTYAPPQFSAGDFNGRTTIFSKLKGAADPLSAHLREKFAPAARAMLDNYDPGRPPPKALAEALSDVLNRALGDRSFYEKERFAHLQLESEAEKVLGLNPQGENLNLVNRVLLERAYPDDLPRLAQTGIANAIVYKPPLVIVLDYLGLISVFYEPTWQRLWCLRMENGFWTVSTPSADQNRLYAADSAGQIQCLGLDGKRTFWTFALPQGLYDFLPYHNSLTPTATSPLIDEESLFIGSSSGSFYVLDKENGGIRQKIDLGSPITATPAISAPLVFLATWNGEVYALAGEKPAQPE